MTMENMKAVTPDDLARMVAELSQQVDSLMAAEINPPAAPEEPEEDWSTWLDPNQVSDLIAATVFQRIHGKSVRYCHDLKSWFVYNGRYWEQDRSEQTDFMAYDVSREYYKAAYQSTDKSDAKKFGQIALRLTSNRNVYALVEAARKFPELKIKPADMDSNHYLLNVENGTIDLLTGILKKHDPADKITKIVNGSFNPAASCPVWLNYLERVMGGNQDLIEFLQRMAGYILTGDTGEHCLFILHGSGRNGKSVFINTLLHILGDYAKQASQSVILDKQSEASNDLAALMGARFAPVSETAEGKPLAEAVVKSLTGGDEISCRFLFGEFFTYRPQAKIILSTNHKPVIKGTDTAIWERIRLIPFEQYIPPEERDPHLLDKLKAEADGILAWMVQGCLVWQRIGLNPPKEVMAATADYRAEMDVLAGFISECCIVADYAKTTAGALFEKYQSWCKENGETALNQRGFGQRLKEKGFNNHRGTAGRSIWQGVGLTAE